MIGQGKQLFAKDTCKVCHALNGAGSKEAPELTGAGSRLRPDTIFTMIQHPQSLVPGTTVEDSYLDDGEIEALTYFLLSQK